MADTYTAHYTLTKPQIGIYDAAWGTKWAANLDAIDTALWAKVDAAGGTLTTPVINGFTGDTSAINIGSGQFVKDANGRVGIGVTPASWHAAYLSLSYGSGQLVGSGGNTQILHTTNLVFTGTGATGWKLPAAVGGSYYQQYLASHQWAVAAANGVNGDATLQQVMIADANGIGYPTGAGGTVTQATSKSTPVTLNKPCGQITMNGAALAAGASVGFQLTNSTIAALDGLYVTLYYPPIASTGNYSITTSTTTGAGFIFVRNTSGGSLSEVIVLNFQVIKGANA